MYEKIKKDFQHSRFMSITMPIIIYLALIVISIISGIIILAVIGICLAFFAIIMNNYYSEIRTNYFKLERTIGLSEYQFKGMLEQSEQFNDYTFINQKFFISFRY